MVRVREARPRDLRKKTPLEWLESQLAQRPEDTGLWYAKGALLAKEGELEKALDAFDRVLWLDRDHLKAHEAKGKALFRLRRYLEAHRAFEELTHKVPRDEEYWYYSGECLLKLGRYTEALGFYDKALDINPNYTDAWYGKGNALKGVGKEETPAERRESTEVLDERLGKFQEALKCFSQVLQLDPENMEAIGEEGALLCEMGNYEEGLARIEKAIRTRPQNLRFIHEKAEILRRMGKEDEARDMYRKLAERPFSKGEDWDPDSWYAKAYASFQMEDFKDTIEHCDRTLELSPHDPRAWRIKGDALAKIGEYAEAIQCYEKSVQSKPRYEHAWLGLAKALRRAGETEEALRAYDRALEVNPFFVEAWYEKGTLQYVSHRFTEALDSFKEALRVDPEHEGSLRIKEKVEALLAGGTGSKALEKVDDLLMKAESAAYGEDYEEALRLYDEVLEMDQQEIRAWDGKAKILTRLSRFSEAAQCYEKSLQVKPGDTEAWLNRGRALREQGRLGEALRSFEEALKLGPQSLTAQVEMKEVLEEIKQRQETQEQVEEVEEAPPEVPAYEVPEIPPFSTHIRVLDSSMEGGVSPGSVVLVTGMPGTFKTSLCFWVLYQQCLKEGRRALFVTLEQSKESLLRHVASLGLDPAAAAGKLRIVDLTPYRREFRPKSSPDEWLQILKKKVKEARKAGVEAFVLDSLEALEAMAAFDDRRREIYRLFEFLRSLELTCFIIAERYEFVYDDEVIRVYDAADYLADGILELTLKEREDGALQRALRIAKMRDRKHVTSLYFLYWDKGFKLTQALVGPRP
ncbi:MAG: tetratricopeptide repeat protein [Thermoplasmata archaeon]